MLRPDELVLQPRKIPQQLRSASTVEAIYTATIQVLLADGALRLTTTRVARRAGVSVGTMYQYFPHKQALLFAILERQLQLVESAMIAATDRLANSDLQTIAHGVAHAWLDAKTADPDASRAIYGIVGDFDIEAQMKRGIERLRAETERLLLSTADARFSDVEASALMLLALLGGSVRVILEGGASPRDIAALRRELPRACFGYLTLASRRHAALD